MIDLFFHRFCYRKEKAGLSPDDDLDNSLLKSILDQDLSPSASDVPDSGDILRELLELDLLGSKVCTGKKATYFANLIGQKL